MIHWSEKKESQRTSSPGLTMVAVAPAGTLSPLACPTVGLSVPNTTVWGQISCLAFFVSPLNEYFHSTENYFISAHLWRCRGRATAAPWHYFFCNVSATLVWISYSNLRRERENICQGEKQQNNWWKLLKKAHENQLVDYKWEKAKRKGNKIFQRRDTRVNFSRSSAPFYICNGPTAF